MVSDYSIYSACLDNIYTLSTLYNSKLRNMHWKVYIFLLSFAYMYNFKKS